MRAYPLIDGTQAADIELKAVRIPQSALLVEPQRALDILEEAVDRAVLAQVAEALGAMEAVLEITNAYLKQRVQFGQPIGKFQALQHRMAEMFVEVQETRSILYRGMAMLDAAPPERKRAISAAKVVAAHAGKFVGAQGIQLHGGIGMTEEYAVGHYYKKLIAFEKRFGDTEHHVSRYCSTRCVHEGCISARQDGHRRRRHLRLGEAPGYSTTELARRRACGRWRRRV